MVGGGWYVGGGELGMKVQVFVCSRVCEAGRRDLGKLRAEISAWAAEPHCIVVPNRKRFTSKHVATSCHTVLSIMHISREALNHFHIQSSLIES